MAAIVFPSNPAAQSPTNTFSPTSVPANTYNSYTYTWNGTAWTSSAAGGGGGTVTGVAGTAPIVSSGGSAPTISITPATSGAAGSMSAADKAKLDGAPTIVSSVTGTAPIAVATGTSTPVVSIGLGLGTAVNGTNIAVSIPVAGVPPAANTTATGATNGSLYWDDNLTQLFIRYSNGGTPVWVAAAPAASGGGGGTVTSVTGTAPIAVANGTTTPAISANLATASDAATGTSATVLMTPQFAVPKDAANMTGAALIPGGNDGARPSPVTGMLRYNSQGGTPVNMEYYDGSGWTQFSTGASTGKVVVWANFDGRGGTTIRTSGNVSSITYNGTGDYTVNFTAALSSANYTTVTGVGPSNIGSILCVSLQKSGAATTSPPTTTSTRFQVWTGNGSGIVDAEYIDVAIIL